MGKVVFKIDEDCEMVRVEVNNVCIFEGNEWDYDRIDTTKEIIKALGIQFVQEEYKYE